jgi:phospholipid-transporting ATPase
MVHQAQIGEYRLVHVNNPAENAKIGYCDNFIVTSKYTMISFIPKFLFETFRKLANLYFLAICVIQCIPIISNTNGQPSTLPPLIFIIMVDAVFAILEDHKRHIADNIANSRPTNVLDPSQKRFVTKKWSEVVVGDIIKLQNRDLAPADVVIIGVSEIAGAPPSGICYVETKSLDGETNMKVRHAMECTIGTVNGVDDTMALVGKIRCEHPNNSINSFQGVLELTSGNHSIPYESTILRGCAIRNTDWVFGIVFNTGKDTKIMMSNSAPPSKMSTMDHSINNYIITLLVILVIFGAVGATGAVIWASASRDTWYLQLDTSKNSRFVDWIIMFFYYLLLLNQFVPISLCVSMSMVKYLQAQFIQWDKEIYYEETDTPTIVRSMSLNEELGQISYVFSDKTGTLTCNIMEFRKCSINGVSYGQGTTEIGIAALKRAGKPIPVFKDDSSRPKTPYVNFDGPELFKDLEGASGDEQKRKIDMFFTHLAVAHTVIPERHDDTNTVTLSASSPDEQALVSGASYFGYEFISRSPGFAHLKLHNTEVKYEILDVLEFNSTRKRMSTIVRHPSGKIHLYTKGADSIIYGLLQKDSKGSTKVQDLQDVTRAHIDQFAEDGLRTLTIAMKEIDPTYYGEWASRFHGALNSLEEIDKRKKDRPNLIDQCMEEMEQGLELLGATAIEDKLQQGVPDTIANLAEAGIKIWVLTGDKEETAINIGFACRLVTNEMRIITINSKTYPTAQAIEKELLNQSLARDMEVREYLETPRQSRGSLRQLALVIDGECLMYALEGNTRKILAEFSQYCVAVIACRVSPAQKAQMVALIKENVPGVRTLAIGDGANDVSMIQEAHIGVGISGQEGMQAANSSDYAIARFRFLERLVLVHGRWNYKRMAQLVLYMFYKNILFTASQYWYTLMCGFSGQKFFLETGIQLYNICLTSIPIVALSILDQDVSDKIAMKFSKLYLSGPRDESLNKKIFSGWVTGAIFESIIITLLCVYSMDKTAYKGGSPSMWLDGNVVFTLVILIANLKLMLHQSSWLFFNHIFYWGSFLCWLLVAAVAGKTTILSELTWEDMLQQTLQVPAFWLLLFFIPIASLWYVILWNGIKLAFFPEYWHLAKESQKFNLDQNVLEWKDSSDASVCVPAKIPHGKGQTKNTTVVPSLKSQSTFRQVQKTAAKVYHGFAFSTDTSASATEARILMSHSKITPRSG